MRVNRNVIELDEIRESRQRERMLLDANRDPEGPFSPWTPDLIRRMKGWVFKFRKQHGHLPPHIYLHETDLRFAPDALHIEGTAIPVVGIGGDRA